MNAHANIPSALCAARDLVTAEIEIMTSLDCGIFFWAASVTLPLTSGEDTIHARIGIVGQTGKKETILDLELLGATRVELEKLGVLDHGLLVEDEPTIAMKLLKLRWTETFSEICAEMTRRTERRDR